jgi:hypothetical protein
MKNKSLFFQIVLLVIVTFLCITLTVTLALLAGSIDSSIFDIKSLNFGNMIPVFIIGGFITFFSVIITVLFISRTLFHKVKDLFDSDNNKKDK